MDAFSKKEIVPFILVLDVTLRFFDRTQTPELRTYCLPSTELIELKFYSADAGFPHLRMGNELNRNLTRNSVADAKTPSVFPNFSKFFLISQNPRNSEKCRVASFFDARILEEKKLR